MNCKRHILRDPKDENKILYTIPPANDCGIGEEVCGGKLKVKFDIDNDEDNRTTLDFDIRCEVCGGVPWRYNLNEFLTDILAKL